MTRSAASDPRDPTMTGPTISRPAEIETLAVGLYESDCRERAGDMARRTTLSRIRAHYSFPAWTNLPGRERDTWRAKARKLIEECRQWLADEAAWDGPDD
jgi:hypothetical protein